MGKKQSRFGIASVILNLIILIPVSISFLSQIAYVNGINPWHEMVSKYEIVKSIFEFPAICFSTIILSGLALGLGIVGLFEKNHNKFFPIIGIVLSILYLVMEIFAYFILEGLSHITL